MVSDDFLYWHKPDSVVNELYEYATSRGITLRDDSPMVNWYFTKSFDTWTVSHPHFYDPLYKTKPIVFELQHYGNVKNDGNWIGKNGEGIIPKYNISGADVFKNALKITHASYVGYHGYVEEFLADNPDLVGELLNLCGYWYFPVSASYPDKLRKGENEIQLSWLNKGVAPAYKNFGLEFLLEAEEAKNSFSVWVENSGNKNWIPEQQIRESYALTIPEDAISGEYNLKFKLKLEEETINIGVQPTLIDKNGFTEIGKISIK